MSGPDLRALVEAELRRAVAAAITPEVVARLVQEQVSTALGAAAAPRAAPSEPETAASAPTTAPRGGRRRSKETGPLAAAREALATGAPRNGRVVTALGRRNRKEQRRTMCETRCVACGAEARIEVWAWSRGRCPCAAVPASSAALGRARARHAALLAETLRDALLPGESLDQPAAEWIRQLPLENGLREPRCFGQAAAALATGGSAEGVTVARTATGWRATRAKP